MSGTVAGDSIKSPKRSVTHTAFADNMLWVRKKLPLEYKLENLKYIKKNPRKYVCSCEGFVRNAAVAQP
jgi:hypothetical protein